MQHKGTTLLIAVLLAICANAQSGLDSLRVMFESLNPANIPLDGADMRWRAFAKRVNRRLKV
jgi:hypothetical protein